MFLPHLIRLPEVGSIAGLLVKSLPFTDMDN